MSLTLGTRPEPLSVILTLGSPFTTEIAVKNSNGTARDMTGNVLRLTIGSTTYDSGAGSATGLFTISLTVSQVAALPASSAARLDLVSGGLAYIWAIGTATVIST